MKGVCHLNSKVIIRNIKVAFWMNSIETKYKSGVQYNDERLLNILKNEKNIDIIKIKVKNNTVFTYFWNLLFLLYKKNYRGCDYALFDGFVPLFSRVKIIGIVHDLMTVNNQVNKSIKRRIIMALYFRILKHKAFKIICVSACTANQLMNRYKVLPRKIEIIPPLIEDPPEQYIRRDNNSSRSHMALKLVFIGANRNNKNIERLICAVDSSNNKIKGFKLVLIGPYNEQDIEYLNTLISSTKFPEIFTIMPNLSRHDKYQTMYNSDFLIMPSLQEGFGMPCLEAFSIGLPVISSDIDVLREITENRAIYFNPLSVDDISNVIIKAIGKDINRKALIEIWEKSRIDVVRLKYLELFR